VSKKHPGQANLEKPGVIDERQEPTDGRRDRPDEQ
jgi:hypothetical protein